MASVGIAHADPDVFLTASQAHAGDAISFSISDVEDHVKYEVEVADRDVSSGEADAANDDVTISVQFTMPDLGSSPKSVTVEIKARDDDGTTTLKRKLQYLGHVPAVVDAPSAPAPAAPSSPASGPAPASKADPVPGTAKAAEPKDGKRAESHRKQRRRSHARKRRAAKQIHEAASGTQRTTPRRASPERSAPAKKRRERSRPRTAPLFDGVPEANTGGSAAPKGGVAETPKKKPPAAVVTAPVANRKPDEPATAILVPGALALAGFMLAGAALLRQRRKS